MSIFELILLVWLPLIIVLFGLLEAFILPLLGTRRKIRRISSNIFILLTTGLIGLTFEQVIQAPVVYHFPNLFMNGLTFRIDLMNYILMIFTGIMWLIINFYSYEDIKEDERERSYYFFYLITYIAVIGTLMAGDLIGFFLFFEIMTFSSYALMVHYREEKAFEAGDTYIYMSIIGALFILSGIVLLSTYTQSYEWQNVAEKFSQVGFVKYVIGFLFLLGFGIKAGIVPVHFWMPKIYRRAPFSVNALSSAVLTKIGAYGILRVATVVFSVRPDHADVYRPVFWQTSENFGFFIIWIGILSMLIGVILALIEGNMKRMLAYHSVSQMGYIVMGIGVAAHLGYKGAMGFTGSIYHMINHGFFKALLFMVAGVVYMKTKEMDMYKLGGLWKKMPFAAIMGLIAVLGIMGIPGFNGYAGKTILHHAIVEAFEYGHPSFRFAETIFIFVSAGTVCSFIKFYSYIFLGKCKCTFDASIKKKTTMSVAMILIASFILFIGLNPSLLLDRLLIPAVYSFSYDAEFIRQHIVNIQFFDRAELGMTAVIFMLGLVMFVLGKKFKMFYYHLPKWMDAERFLYRPITSFCDRFSRVCVKKYEKPLKSIEVMMFIILLVFILGLMEVSSVRAIIK